MTIHPDTLLIGSTSPAYDGTKCVGLIHQACPVCGHQVWTAPTVQTCPWCHVSMVHDEFAPDPDYPLKSLWDEAVRAVSALVVAVMENDQEWHAPVDHVLADAEQLLIDAHDSWVYYAEQDGRLS